ncbi:hypothetical protein SSS_09850 [Sarcoptes scabiei]|nr:hypothetical protein SSS_09850 [Sarcoptes scabiei]
MMITITHHHLHHHRFVRYRCFDSIWFVTMIAIWIISIASHQTASILKQKPCWSSEDCATNQCCSETPIGKRICLDYEQQGERCFFRFRTPTCGCAEGLKCVSTSPMQPGNWNHDYVCARVRPFQHHKLMPYFEDFNEY